MRALLSTIGSRGDVQPLLALAVQLRELGQEVRLCAPPDFRGWVERFRIPFVPIGPEVRSTAKPSSPVARARPTTEQMRQIAQATVATQFTVIPVAAEGCDILMGGGALQIALRTVAEQRGIPYVYASYCPVSLPSSHHAPPQMARRHSDRRYGGQQQALGRGCATLERLLGRGSQLAPGISRT